MPCSKFPEDVRQILKNLKKPEDYHSFTSLGPDGVMRSIHSETGEVLDAVGLTPIQIEGLFHGLFKGVPDSVPKSLIGVDGSQLDSQALFHPAEGILPEKLTEEEEVAARKMIDKEREVFLSAKDPQNMTPEESLKMVQVVTEGWRETMENIKGDDPARVAERRDYIQRMIIDGHNKRIQELEDEIKRSNKETCDAIEGQNIATEE